MLFLANLYLGVFLIVITVLTLFYIFKFKKEVVYQYSLVSFIKSKGYKNFSLPYYFYKIIRFLILLLLALLAAKPQLINYKKPVNVEGIDIVLTLDVSGSMQSFDDLSDQRSRFEVAKDEAIKFVDKRDSDSIGLVIFAKQAVTRCPLTLDKKMLKDILRDLKLGYIDGDGTAISRSLLTSANRLKNSESKSKVIIFLTDGQPTVRDVDPNEVIKILNKLDIKVYTIGVGNQQGGYVQHPLLGIMQTQNSLNIPLLRGIAEKTGGEFFLAQNPQDMKDIYKKINELEKTERKTKVYYSYLDFFIPIIFVVLLLLFVELFFSIFVWFVL